MISVQNDPCLAEPVGLGHRTQQTSDVLQTRCHNRCWTVISGRRGGSNLDMLLRRIVDSSQASIRSGRALAMMSTVSSAASPLLHLRRRYLSPMRHTFDNGGHRHQWASGSGSWDYAPGQGRNAPPHALAAVMRFRQTPHRGYLPDLKRTSGSTSVALLFL